MDKTFFKILGMAVIGIAFSSCTKNDIFEEQNEAIFNQHKKEYAANFIKKYGEIDPNKSWDMSSKQPQYSLTSKFGATRAITRGTDSYSRTKTTGFTVEKDILTWFFQNTPAGKNNRQKGNPFFLKVSAEPFTIVPIFQGNAKKYWQLWMHVDGIEKDIMVWEKGEDLKYITATGDLKSTGTGQAGVDRDAEQVIAPAITFSGMPTGDMHFYLKAWNTAEAYENDPMLKNYTTMSSLKQKMLAMDQCTKPNGVPDNVSYRIIGCEDWTDNDYEDLAFLIYGSFTIIQPEEVFEAIPKRYMVEDLGSTDDFDFNDVVVDLFDEYKTVYTYSTTNNVKTLIDTDGPVRTKQWAVVRAAGGIYDFTIKIGNSATWTKSDHVTPVTEMKNTGVDGAINYGEILGEFDIKNMDWDPVADNITIEVDSRGNSTGVYYIPFPKDGDVPMIIAVDASVNWMHERNGVPVKWIQASSNNQGNPDNQENQNQ